ncbi:MAG TPA: hypothetical protein VN380_26410 [Thermoanaerobaculia bacterium]|jgi:hypothetical protein|nr:hypothetical protein [Thermoanaerobaculia bacterium]
MATDQADESVLSWLQGYRNADESQADLRPGDPQQAALAQFLGDQKLSHDQIIVDFGSGRGLLAQMLKHVYKGRDAPRYFAVDLPHELDELSIPNPIHNDSRKITLGDFYSSELKAWQKDIGAVVIRNVLHELTIEQTCLLFRALNEQLRPEAVIYIQDMTDLPRAEERHVGWPCDILIEFLRDMGIIAETFGLASFSGTNWFTLTAHPTGSAINETQALEAAIRAREKQKKQMVKELSKLDARHNTDDYVREIKLNHEIASLEFQLSEARPADEPAGGETDDINVPLIERATFGPLDFALSPGEGLRATGLQAVLSHKRLIDFAALLATCEHEALFSGYSQRSLFQQADIRSALYDMIVRRQCIVRILVVEPDSATAQLRGSEPLYADPAQLRRDIRFTLDEAEKFTRVLTGEKGDHFAHEHFQLRTSPSIPYSSYFIIDDKCFVSLYSQTASGTRAPCFVYRATDALSNGYLYVLRNDFNTRWNVITGATVATAL